MNFFRVILFIIMTSASHESLSQSDFKVLAFYRSNVEKDHTDFARDAILFFKKLSVEKNFTFDTTKTWALHTDDDLRKYDVIVWLNEFPHAKSERAAFEKYMDNGGRWLGFHVSGYTDKTTNWQWFVDFLGGAVFNSNNWPPLPAKLIIEDQKHPVTKDFPNTYQSPINEWYIWNPSPRLNRNVKVLVTLDPSNYPLGKKNIIREGDLPVVWTNTKYKMLYTNMGHGDKVMTDSLQNQLITNALMWLAKN